MQTAQENPKLTVGWNFGVADVFEAETEAAQQFRQSFVGQFGRVMMILKTP